VAIGAVKLELFCVGTEDKVRCENRDHRDFAHEERFPK
jgi:hypothetical protein